MASALPTIHQAAAIPIRNGRVCLVTSRGGKRWVIPKGCLEPGKNAEQIASQEAWEEAGLVGLLHPEPLGSYDYQKRGCSYHVTVFLLLVTGAAGDWPEGVRRRRRWFRPAKARRRVDHPGVRQVLRASAAFFFGENDNGPDNHRVAAIVSSANGVLG